MKVRIIHTSAGVAIVSQRAAYIEVTNPSTGQRDIWGLGRQAAPQGLTKLGIEHVVTNRFPIDPNKHSWLTKPNELHGKRARLEVSGHSYFGWGQVKIKLVVYDAYGSPEHQLTKAFAKTRSQSFVAGQSDVRGELKLLSPAECSIPTDAKMG